MNSSSQRTQSACPYCMTVVHPAAKVCNGCGAVKSNWSIQGFPVVPLFWLGTLAAYLLCGPFAIYHAMFNAKGDMQILLVGLLVTVIGAFVLRWLTLSLAQEKWFRRK